MELKVDQGNAWWSNAHFNFGVLYKEKPCVRGPEKDSEHELVPKGLEGMKLDGLDAGDG